MAQVEVQVPQLGIVFQGEAGLPISAVWLDGNGDPLPPAATLSIPLEVTEFATVCRFTNPNDEAKVAADLSFAGTDPVVGAAAAFPFTIPAQGSADLTITLTISGAQTHEQAATFNVTGMMDTPA